MSNKTATLRDDFSNAGNSDGRWYGLGVGENDPLPVVSGGQLTIPGDSSFPSIISSVPYDLTSSSIHVELIQKLNTGLGSTSVEFGVRVGVDNGDKVQFVVYGDWLIMQELVDGVASETSTAYSNVTHRWLRIRESSGTVYWDTSSDGISWTMRRSKATAFDLTSVQPRIGGGYWDAETDPGSALFDNLNTFAVPAHLQGWTVGSDYSMGARDGGTLLYRNFFQDAEWLWAPIPNDPVLDVNSEAIAADLTWEGISPTNGNPVLLGAISMYNYGSTMIFPEFVNVSTPRYAIEMLNEGTWGPHPFGADTVPIPDGTIVPPGSDGHLSVADPINGKVYSLWQAYKHADGHWVASWGGVCDLDGDGIETTGSSTATNLSRYGAVLRMAELEAGEIPHALFFAAGNTKPTTFRYPATKTDGINYRGSAFPIEEGTRVQLDPTIDLAAIPGISKGELAIGRAMQIFGGYCGDKSDSGGGFGFICQYDETATGTDDPGSVYEEAGFLYDYFVTSHIPWSELRVLNSWNGS